MGGTDIWNRTGHEKGGKGMTGNEWADRERQAIDGVVLEARRGGVKTA